MRLLKEEEDRLLKEQLEILDNNIKTVSSAFSTYTRTSIDELEFEDKDMTSVLPVIVVKEEYQTGVVGVVVRADVQLFKDQVNNALAKANHPNHSKGCAHLLDDEPRYRERVGNKYVTLPKIAKRETMPSIVTSTVVWK